MAVLTLGRRGVDTAYRGREMRDLLKRLVRDPQGAWHCVEATEMELPRGRIQVAPGARFYPGTEFMGVDVAKLLDEQFKLDRQR